jgi:hypothetical protein
VSTEAPAVEGGVGLRPRPLEAEGRNHQAAVFQDIGNQSHLVLVLQGQVGPALKVIGVFFLRLAIAEPVQILQNSKNDHLITINNLSNLPQEFLTHAWLFFEEIQTP